MKARIYTLLHAAVIDGITSAYNRTLEDDTLTDEDVIDEMVKSTMGEINAWFTFEENE